MVLVFSAATVQASLVALYYMHLRFEPRLAYDIVLILLVLFDILLLVLLPEWPAADQLRTGRWKHVGALDHQRASVGMAPCQHHRLEAMTDSLFRNQPHRLQELSTGLRATQQSHMFDPALGEGLPASHLGVPTALRAENSDQRCGLCHGSTPSRLCPGSGIVLDREGIRRVFQP
jgi:hypothetical protein